MPIHEVGPSENIGRPAEDTPSYMLVELNVGPLVRSCSPRELFRDRTMALVRQPDYIGVAIAVTNDNYEVVRVAEAHDINTDRLLSARFLYIP